MAIAIAIDRPTTIVECPSEKNKPDRHGSLAFLHQLARYVVDRRDVVGVEGVPQPEGIGQESRSELDGVSVEGR